MSKSDNQSTSSTTTYTRAPSSSEFHFLGSRRIGKITHPEKRANYGWRPADNVAKFDARRMTTAEVQTVFDGTVKLLRGLAAGTETQAQALNAIEMVLVSAGLN